AVGEVHVARLDHLAARGRGARRFHAHAARQLAPLRALRAHGLQPAHAPFVARAAGLDALADPGLLLREQAVEARVLLRLGVQALVAPAQVVLPVARPAGDPAAVDLDDPRGQRAQEAAVVGDEHHRALPGLQEP